MALAALVYLVVVPAVASLIAIALGWLAYSDLKSRDTSGGLTGGGPARFPVFPAIVVTAVILGLVLWMLGNDLEDRIAMGLASTPDPTYALADRLFTWTATAYALVATLGVLSEALTVRARIREFVGDDFGRVLPLVVLPETPIIFALVLAFLVLGQITSLLDVQLVTTATKVEAVVTALQVFTFSAVAVPLAILAGTRVKDLHGSGFLRAIVLGESGVVVVLLAFVWAFMQLAAL